MIPKARALDLITVLPRIARGEGRGELIVLVFVLETPAEIMHGLLDQYSMVPMPSLRAAVLAHKRTHSPAAGGNHTDACSYYKISLAEPAVNGGPEPP
jgi:hypothetical protein